MRECHSCREEVICWKTGCQLLLDQKMIEDKPYHWSIRGDLYYCPFCHNLQLEGTGEPCIEYHAIISNVIGNIKICDTPEMRKFHQDWYPDTEVQWEKLD